MYGELPCVLSARSFTKRTPPGRAIRVTELVLPTFDAPKVPCATVVYVDPFAEACTTYPASAAPAESPQPLLGSMRMSPRLIAAGRAITCSFAPGMAEPAAAP